MTQDVTRRVLSASVQEFRKIREDGQVYVDKTKRIYELIKPDGKTYFLSRPRRFGKSLLCSTIAAIFEGWQNLFGEIAGMPALAIHSLAWEWKHYPVIRIDLNAGEYALNGAEELRRRLHKQMQSQANKFGTKLDPDDGVVDQFEHLIEGACEKTGENVVIIIDEYDEPLISTLNNPDEYEQLRLVLRAFYGVLKSHSQYLRFVFITGVSKFARSGLFSGLNQPIDMTLSSDYADICGFTQE
jgi:hypothetical protein